MIRIFHLLVLVFCVLAPVRAQISDSLYNALPIELRPVNKRELTDAEKFNLLIFTEEQNRHFYKELYAIVVGMDSKLIATTDKDIQVTYAAAIGDFYVNADNYPKATEYYKKAIRSARGTVRFDSAAVHAYMYVSAIYAYTFQEDSAVEYLHKGLQIAGSRKDTVTMTDAYNTYQLIYTNLSLREKAIEYAYKQLALMPPSKKWDNSYTIKSLQIADLYSQLYDDTKREMYLDSSLDMIHQIMTIKKNEDMYWYTACYVILGRQKLRAGDYKEALNFFDSSLLQKYTGQSLMGPDVPVFANLQKIVCQMKLNVPNSVQELKSLKFLPNQFWALQLQNKTLYEHYKQKGESATALQYHEQYIRFTDSLAVIANRGKIFDATQKYEAAQKQLTIDALENKNLQEKNSKRELIIIAMAVVILLMVGSLLLYLNNKRLLAKRAKEGQVLAGKLRTMETDMLLQQVKQQADSEEALVVQRQNISKDLHDEVSSSVATLRFLIMDELRNAKQEETKKVLGGLYEETGEIYAQVRDFMHRLYKTNAAPVYNVIEFLDNLAITFGSGSSLRVITGADTESVELFFTPKQHMETYLFIKEAASNCMKHAGASKMSIRLYLQDGCFHIAISDNGKGLQENVRGIGMQSMHERMQALGGEIKVWTDNGLHILGTFPIRQDVAQLQ